MGTNKTLRKKCSQIFACSSPNLSILLVGMSNVQVSLSEIQRHFLVQKLQTTYWVRVPGCSFAFLSSTVPFLEVWCRFHSFIYCYNLLFVLVNLDRIPSLAKCYFLFMIAISLQLILCACNSDVISNWTAGI